MPLQGEILVGRYRVLRELGSGGMGTVYLAEHVHLGRPTAIKVLRAELSSNPDAEARFRREALLAAKLMHPAVAQIFDFDRTPEGQFLIAMEYVEGETLAQRLRREGPFPVAMAIQILRGIADGLDRAHALGIVHRDIKPENVMLAAGGAVKLLDFGVARDIQTSSSGPGSLTSAGITVGTPAYMSPEQLLGEAPTATSDVYALGTVIYEMLTGRQPHSGATFAEFRVRRLMHPAPQLHAVRAECPAALSAVLARALEAESTARWPSAGAFARAATDALHGQSTGNSPDVHHGAVGDETHRPDGLDAQFEALRLAGRDREMRIVRDAWAAARAGRTTVLWIEGDEGAGKSIFFRLAQREAAADGAVSIVGRGYHTELAAPYGTWLPMLRAALALRAGKEGSWPAIAALTGSRLEAPAPERAALYDEVAVLFAAAAARGPLFIGVDDIDWCDPASVSLFEYLSHAVTDAPLLLVATATTDRAGGIASGEIGRQTRERLRRLDHTVWLALRPLGYEPVASWLTRALGREAPDELVRFVYGHTEGNAFFIEQVVRSLVEHGNMERMSSETGRFALADYPPPEAVADVVQRRLAGMSESAREVLQIAAVAGREFDVDVVLALSKHAEDAVLDALDEATAAGVLEPVSAATGDRYRFTQYKIVQVLAQAMNSRRRRRLHARVAQELSARHKGQVPPGALAWHWYHAGEMARASITAREAARQALTLHAYDDALTFGAMAAGSAQTPAERCEAHELRGDALRRLDREAEAAAAYAHARLVGAGDDEAMRTLRRKELRSALRAGTVSAATVTAEARKLLEGAAALPAPRRCAYELLLAEALVEANEGSAAIDAARNATTSAREAGDAGQLADATLVLGTALLRGGATLEADDVAREACAICDALGDPYIAARAALLSGAVCVSRADLAGARLAYAGALRHAERAQVPRLVRQVRERQADLSTAPIAGGGNKLP